MMESLARMIEKILSLLTPKIIEVKVPIIEIPKEHQKIIDNLKVIHSDRAWDLKPICVFKGQEPPFWNKDLWNKPFPHSIWLCLWVERKFNMEIVDVACVFDLWTRDDGISIEMARLDGDTTKFSINVFYKSKLIKRLWNKYESHLLTKESI